MQEKEWQLADASLYYETEKESGGRSVRITQFQGLASQVEVPERIQGMPVRSVDRKAFLSKKNLRRIWLPDTLEEIGDWAFAYCGNLAEIRIPCRAVRFGKAVFMECKGLKRISVARQLWEESGAAFPAELMAAAVTVMDAAYLLDMEAAGTEEWIGKWDARLSSVLHVPDQEGFSRQVLCGEEDYGSTDLAAYMNGRRKEKARLCFLRLLYDQGLSAPFRQELEDYLRSHTKGQDSEEAWQVILREHGAEREYYQLFAAIGCVSEDNLNEMLTEIGGEYPEMKAYFLRCGEKADGAEDFFAGLEL
ncbi:MAG: leucine-rich repeat domain-containing protein [Eubacterium sp.]|nr:leucine-rich repeat domain-containing protein [Eubacterium sp.]